MDTDFNRGLKDPNPEPQPDERLDEYREAQRAPANRASSRRSGNAPTLSRTRLEDFNDLVLALGCTSESVKTVEAGGEPPPIGPLYVEFHRLLDAAGLLVHDLRSKGLIQWDSPTAALFLIRVVVVHAATRSYARPELAGDALVALVRFGHDFARRNVVPMLEGARREVVELVDFQLTDYVEAGRFTIFRRCDKCKAPIKLARPGNCKGCGQPLTPGGSFVPNPGQAAGAERFYAWNCKCGRTESVALRHNLESCRGPLSDPNRLAMRQRHFNAIDAVRELVLEPPKTTPGPTEGA